MRTNVILSVLFLISCSTPYQPIGALGGYSSSKIGANTFQVEFKGNQHTNTLKTFEYLERRCAEITIENGYEYFIVYEDNSYVKEDIYKLEADPDNQIDAFQSPIRIDNYLLDREPDINRERIEVMLMDKHSKIARTYGSGVGENRATDVTGVYKIMLVNDVIEEYSDYYHPAKEILEKYNK